MPPDGFTAASTNINYWWPQVNFTHRFYGELMTQDQWWKRVDQASREGIDALPEPRPPKAPTLIAKRFNRQQPRWSAEAWKSTT